VVSFTPQPLYSQGKSSRYPLDRRLGGPQSYMKQRFLITYWHIVTAAGHPHFRFTRQKVKEFTYLIIYYIYFNTISGNWGHLFLKFCIP
jgi:hypothetical protein